MKKKETLFELLKRLDEEAGRFSVHLSEANRYFDNTATATKNLVVKHEKDVHRLINKIKITLKPLLKQKKKKSKKNKR